MDGRKNNMAKVQLVVADQDKDYLQAFTQYISTSEFSEKITVKCFSLEESLEQYLRDSDDVDLLLVHPQLLPESTSLKNITTVLLLSEQPYREDIQSHSTIYKYQPLNQLLTQVLSHLIEKNQTTYSKNKRSKKTKVLSIYSAVGGLGKTTLALNLARELSSLDLKIFYLNLEYVSSCPLFFGDSSQEQTFSDILYYLEASPQNILSKIEKIKKHDPKTKIDYFSALENPQEILDLTLEKSSLLIDSLGELGSYDLVIIDLESSINDRTFASFIDSDYIFWLVADNVQCLTKTDAILTYFKKRYTEQYKDFCSNIYFLLNKYTGKRVNSFEEFGIEEICAQLPYIPEWKSIGNMNSAFESAIYIKQVMSLHQSLLNDIGSIAK
jgi:MinD-like ATPase involved in chromosome partitioning or flagellar assembly